MEIFSARPSRPKIILLILGSIAFVFMGFWIAGFFGPVPRPGMEWIGWICFLFFGACGIIWVRAFFDQGEQMRVSAAGIYWKRWSSKTIPWTEIKDVSEWSYKGQRMIVLHLMHPDLFPAETKLGRLNAMNKSLTGGDLAISLSGTNRGFDEAMAAIARFRPQ